MIEDGKGIEGVDLRVQKGTKGSTELGSKQEDWMNAGEKEMLGCFVVGIFYILSMRIIISKLSSVNQMMCYKYKHKQMTKIKKPIFTLFSVSLLIILTTSSSPTWNTYLTSHHHTYSPKSFTLSHPSFPNIFITFASSHGKIKQQYNHYYHSQYIIEGDGKDGEYGVLKVWANGDAVDIGVKKGKGKYSVKVQCLADVKDQFYQKCKEKEGKFLEHISKEKNVHKYCKLHVNTFDCQMSKVEVQFHIRSEDRNITKQDNHKQKLQKFAKTHNISLNNKTQPILQNSISSLFNSICLHKQQDQQLLYMGFCNQQNLKYNYKLAPLSISLLADYDHSLANLIYNDYFQLLETQTLYPTQNKNYNEVPQYVQILTKFAPVLSLQRESELLNSLFVLPMLSQLGTLHEEVNYREAKKFHPLLLKMLTQKWSSSSKLLQFSSIYEQSFTQDFKYHQYGVQQLDQSVCKIAHIFKTVDIFTTLQIQHHSYYMSVEQVKQHLSQHFTLKNILSIFVNDDQHAKNGIYSDIVKYTTSEQLRVYSKLYGYEALLVYVYGLGKIFPSEQLKTLSTSAGLKSISAQNDYSYRYRGQVHSYFNFRIIKAMIQKIQSQMQKNKDKAVLKQILSNLQKLGEGAANTVIKGYEKDGKIWTSWQQDGKGRESVGWGRIVSAVLLQWAQL